jgi:hypothetical protein
VNSTECDDITARIASMCRWQWSPEKLAEFSRSLAFSTIGVISHRVVDDTLTVLFSELDADLITPAKLVEAVKTRPVRPPVKYLPEPTSSESTVTRGLRYAERAGVPRSPRNEQNRAVLADLLVSLGKRMHMRCDACRREFSENDVHAYTLACMDAGSAGREQPERRCLDCGEWRVEQGVEARCPF